MSKGFKSDVNVEGKLLASNGTSIIENAAAEVYLNNTSGNYRIKTAPTKDSDLSTNDVLGWDKTLERLRRINTARFEILSGTGNPNVTNEIAWYENQLYLDITDPDNPKIHRAEIKATDPDTSSAGSVWRIVPLGEKQDYLSDLVNAEISINTSTTLTIGRQHAASVVVARTYTLPAASGNTGKFISIRILSTSTKLATIKGDGAELIDGVNTRIMWAGESATLYCDGTGWTKIAGKSIPMSCIIALNSSAGGYLTNTTTKKILIDSIRNNNTGLMANVANNRIDIIRPGTYRFDSSIQLANISNNMPRLLNVISVNGVGAKNSDVSALAAGYPTSICSLTSSVSAGDYIDIAAYQNSGASQTVFGASTSGLTSLEAIEIPRW